MSPIPDRVLQSLTTTTTLALQGSPAQARAALRARIHPPSPERTSLVLILPSQFFRRTGAADWRQARESAVLRSSQRSLRLRPDASL